MRFIDFFAGIGGFRQGLELSGHECVGFCEFDKFATASYTSMHLLNEEQRKKLSEIPQRKRQKEILKEEYRNGEWYAKDIRSVNAKDVPRAECWCFGAPCQDFSIAGRRAGLDGDRSSLIREIFRLLEEQEEQDRPEWLIYENVKGMLSSNRGLDYLSILSEMDRLGYDCEWQNINSKWYVPQNRERIYTIGHLRKYGRRKILPVTGADGENSVCQIGKQKSHRNNPNQNRVYNKNGIAPCLNTMEGGGREPHVALPCFIDMNYNAGISITENARTLQARYNKGINNRAGETSGVAIPVLTLDRAEKRQNGRRFKDNGDPMFTLTAQDRHGVGIEVIGKCEGSGFIGNESRKRIYSDKGISPCLNGIGNGGNTEPKIAIQVKRSTNNVVGCIGGLQEHQTVRNDGISPTLTSAMGMGGGQTPCVFLKQDELEKQGGGIYVEMPEGFIVYAIWYEKEHCYITIRKLTPKECFRLQGWTDDYFEKAAFVNTDNQLYKQAGNGVTVNVVEAIGKKIKEYENN